MAETEIDSTTVVLKKSQIVLKTPIKVSLSLFKDINVPLKERFKIRIFLLKENLILFRSGKKKEVQTEFNKLVKGLRNGESKIEI